MQHWTEARLTVSACRARVLLLLHAAGRYDCQALFRTIDNTDPCIVSLHCLQHAKPRPQLLMIASPPVPAATPPLTRLRTLTVTADRCCLLPRDSISSTSEAQTSDTVPRSVSPEGLKRHFLKSEKC